MRRACKLRKIKPESNATNITLNPSGLFATINDRTGRAEYEKPNNGDNPAVKVNIDGKWIDVQAGHEWVVPYNPYLLLLFDGHVCVDAVTATICILLYMFKYCHKASDYAKARIQGVTNEIEQYSKT